jgi:nucleotide exchange factor SIL1
VKRKFRPYDELKKDLESMNIKIETDHEILTKLIKQLGKTDNEENRKTILTDLEFYLHQVRIIFFALVFG